MRAIVRAVVGWGVVTCAALAGLNPARALPVTLIDEYYGGANYYNNGGVTNDAAPPSQADVIGPTDVFDIISAEVERVGTGGNTLQVTINTNYAGVPGTSAADGTGYGALFITPGAWNPTGTGPHYSTDVYVDGEWKYAFTVPENPGPATSGTGGLYDTSKGQVVLSNVGGNPISYPNPGSPPYYFRQGQAVQYIPDPNISPLGTGTWSVDSALHTLTFSIVDNNLLGNNFAVAWAMTCANDVIQGSVNLPDETQRLTPTPLPAALPLFVSGGGLMAWLGRRKRRMGKVEA